MKSLCVILFSLLGLSFLPAQVPAQDGLPPIYLILDGSGSMWGQIQGQNKIGIARSVIGSLLDKMNPEQAVGLFAYGHRRKGDCEDIEKLEAPGLNNHNRIKDRLSSLKPIGKTPLAATALRVIDELKRREEKATIILVSDGAESCGGDLCEVVQAAKEAGLDFVLHIVGFDIGESDKLALQCAAKAGEGLYLDAANGEELSAALEQTTELTVESLEPSLSVQVSKDGELHDAAVQIFKPGDENYFTSLRTYTHEKTNPALFRIPPGTYHVKAVPLGTDADVLWEKEVVVTGEIIKEVQLDFTAGYLSIGTSANGELWDCVVNIIRISDGKSVAGGRTYKAAKTNPMRKELSPGNYEVKLSAGKLDGRNTTHVFKQVEVLPGKTQELAHDFSYGELSILATNNGELWDCVIHMYEAHDPKQKSIGGGRTYATANSNPMQELLTPGVYAVKYRARNIHGQGWEHIKEIEVNAGEKAELVHNYRTGMLKIGGTHKGAQQTIDVTLMQEGKSIYSKRISNTSGGNPREIVLLPGDYKATITPVKLDASARTFPLKILVGETVEKLIEF